MVRYILENANCGCSGSAASLCSWLTAAVCICKNTQAKTQPLGKGTSASLRLLCWVYVNLLHLWDRMKSHDLIEKKSHCCSSSLWRLALTVIGMSSKVGSCCADQGAMTNSAGLGRSSALGSSGVISITSKQGLKNEAEFGLTCLMLMGFGRWCWSALLPDLGMAMLVLGVVVWNKRFSQVLALTEGSGSHHPKSTVVITGHGISGILGVIISQKITFPNSSWARFRLVDSSAFQKKGLCDINIEMNRMNKRCCSCIPMRVAHGWFLKQGFPLKWATVLLNYLNLVDFQIRA